MFTQSTSARLLLLLSTCFCLGLSGGVHAEVGEAETVDDAATQAGLSREQAVPADVWERIRAGFAIPELENATVDKWTAFYARDPKYVERMALRASRYLYNIVEEVEARRMPTELALLPFVESAFQPEALSRAKAAGLWQFMPATGRNFSLEQNLWRDERQDVLESTRAALDYFEYLNKLFNDWQLALAAYNWGEGSVQRAISRATKQNRPTDYAHLRMPSETANYVPKLEAIKRIISNPEKYGITLPDVGNEPFFVRVTKPRDIDVKTAARLAGMSESEFRALNPSFKLPVIVASHNNVMLLPADRLDFFVDNLASWMDSGQPLSHWNTYRLKEGETLADVAGRAGMTESFLREVNGIPTGRKVLPNSTLLVLAEGDEQVDIAAEEADARLRLSSQTTWRRVTYRVRGGDTLSSIARRWHITQRSIIQNNRLRSNRLSVGQRLVLTVPNVARDPISATAGTVRVTSNNSNKTNTTATTNASGHIIHAVRQGDSLYSIGLRYGVSVAAIRNVNRLSSNAIHAGQRLRIPKGASEGTSMEATESTKVRTYVVKAGDTLSSIARNNGVTVDRLQRQNRLTSSTLHVGMTLEIPSTTAVNRPVRQPATAQSPSVTEYVVTRGDTLSSIALHYGTTPSKLRATNGLRTSRLSIGQRLVIPASASRNQDVQEAQNAPATERGRIYRVRAGDTLSSIAAANDTTVSELRRENQLTSSRLSVGQTLRLP